MVRLGCSDKMPWLLSGDSLKSRLWNATRAEISLAKRNKPGFAFSLVDGIPPQSYNINQLVIFFIPHRDYAPWDPPRTTYGT